MHSAEFDEIKSWYDEGHWNRKMVIKAMEKGRITEAECREIIGED